MRKILVLLVVLSLAMCVSVFAAAGDVGTIKKIDVTNANTTVDYKDGDVNFELTYNKAVENGMYLVMVLSEDNVPKDGNILYVNQVTAEGTSVTFDNVYPSEITDGYIYLSGTGMDYTKLGEIEPNKEVVAADVTVTVVGTGPQYTVDGHNVTVSNSLPCKVGYESAGTYVAIKGTANPDGSYSYVVPEEVDEVVVVVKGDVSGDGKLLAPDVIQAKAAQLGKLAFTELKKFAADVSGDGKLLAPDVIQAKAAQLGKLKLAW